MKNNIIDLTKKNIEQITYENVIAITIAEGGAMGEPNAFHVVTKSLEHYYTNLGNTDISRETFFDCFPLLKKIHCFCEELEGLEKDWSWFNMGFGNYLIIRTEYNDEMNNCIKTRLTENWQRGELYNNWYDLVKSIILDRKYKRYHDESFQNKMKLINTGKCVCFYCGKRFNALEIEEWIQDKKGNTAICPYCNIDSVIPTFIDGEEITDEIIHELYEYYFNSDVN